jgi:hypothetical protein
MLGGVETGRQRDLDTGDIGLGIHHHQRHEHAVVEAALMVEPGVDSVSLQQTPDAPGEFGVTWRRIFILIGFGREAAVIEQ